MKFLNLIYRVLSHLDIEVMGKGIGFFFYILPVLWEKRLVGGASGVLKI